MARAGVVGWIGLGEMGLPMAANLVRAGHRVLGYDLGEPQLQAARRAGIETAVSSTEVGAAADVVVTMLRTGAQTEELLAGEGGLAAVGAAGGALDVVVMSTLDPGLMERLADETAGRLTIVDAPVSGGVRGAEAGTLAIMASGPSAAVARVRPLLEVLGGAIFELGPRAGLGQAVKVANQVMMAAAIAGTLEGLAVAGSYGLAETDVVAAVSAGTGSSWALDHWDWMRSLWEGYVPGNALDVLVKDLRAITEAASLRQAPLPVAAIALARLLELRGDGA
jgi:3-hydroxyisobutyrate dehydrogenase-like beta-hydroxyacid dehydrogenase